MFDNLLVSNPKNRGFGQSLSGTLMSTVLHGVLIWGAVNATLSSAVESEEEAMDTTMVFLTEEEPEPEPEDEPPPIQQVLNLEPPPKGFQKIGRASCRERV